jgi:uncharacterized RDD family membrane protein YckC
VTESDPYRPPQAEVELAPDPSRVRLGGRAERLAAALIDWLIYAVGWVVCMAGFWIPANDEIDNGGIQFLTTAGFVVSAAGVLLLAGIFALQLHLLWKNGWTIGKRLLRIRIVRPDGSRCGLARIFFLRMCTPTLLGAIPLLGPLFQLADALFIFGPSRRCLHDRIAGTIVVRA